jgi:uncharacterized surface protein with fasciclin (FAS1) repeats
VSPHYTLKLPPHLPRFIGQTVQNGLADNKEVTTMKSFAFALSLALTTLVAAVKAAGLVDALMGAGPFTVFAPVNDAFAALPAGTVDTLLKPENKDTLTKVLTAHVVAGDLKTADLIAMAAKSPDGFANLQTLSGDALSVKVKGGKLMVYSESQNIGEITIADVDQSNGVIHVVNAVLVPK